MPDNLLSRATPGPVSIESKARSTPPTHPTNPSFTSVWIRPLPLTTKSCFSKRELLLCKTTTKQKGLSEPFQFLHSKSLFSYICHILPCLQCVEDSESPKHVLRASKQKNRPRRVRRVMSCIGWPRWPCAHRQAVEILSIQLKYAQPFAAFRRKGCKTFQQIQKLPH